MVCATLMAFRAAGLTLVDGCSGTTQRVEWDGSQNLHQVLHQMTRRHDQNFPGRTEPGMKTVFLIRHAKSSWDDTTLPDRDRPLDARGERDVAMMSKRLSRRHAKPDLIMSSPAVRALATAQVIAKGLDYKLKGIAVNDRLYAATADALIAVIEELDDKFERVMLVGHNPEFTDFAHHFSSEITHMPTCAIAVFTFDAKTWSGIGQAKPVRTDFDSPKQSSG